MTDLSGWRLLRKGEVVQKGDLADVAPDGYNDPADWQPVKNSIGQTAPDPRFPAHRRFLRKINDD